MFLNNFNNRLKRKGSEFVTKCDKLKLEAVKNAEQLMAKHLVDVNKTINMPKSANKDIDDILKNTFCRRRQKVGQVSLFLKEIRDIMIL